MNEDERTSLLQALHARLCVITFKSGRRLSLQCGENRQKQNFESLICEELIEKGFIAKMTYNLVNFI
ncbi:hypothetical protein NGI13_21925 [Enterobacter asburiae]|uniref:hypothetical protein n=1 Tax=Enterobacter asburiae TaxID=61645 RepID=UPI002DB9D4C1|nr:hypothetical protein [Enterobacter asburiae]MEB8258217.1 hypothetical protein [Enterobacter asburiae]